MVEEKEYHADFIAFCLLGGPPDLELGSATAEDGLWRSVLC